MTDKKKREYLITICKKYLETSKELMLYFKAVANTRKGKYACNRSIKSIDMALVHIDQIKHIEVLEYIYSTYIGNNVIAHSVSGSIVLSKKINEYDTDEGVKILVEEINERKKQQEEKIAEKQRQKEIIEKAKAEGKKVEMVWDNETKTTKPMIIEENDNA